MENQQKKKTEKRPETPLAPTPVVKWIDNVRNPSNEEYVVETAYNLDKKPKDVTQDEFSLRYNIKKDSLVYNRPKKK
jgi:hypothetical protein